MYIADSHLKSFLADAGLVSQKEFDAAKIEAAESGKTVGEILTAKNDIGEDELRRSCAYALGIPFVSLIGESIGMDALSLIPEPIARRHNVVAYARENDRIEVAMLDTDDLAAIEFLKKKAHLTILPRLTDAASVKSALRQYQQGLKRALGDVIRREVEALEKSAGAEDTNLRKLSENAHAVGLVDALLRHASAQSASDIHIEPEEEALRIRYRIGGTLYDAMELPTSAGPAVAARLKALAGMRLEEYGVPQEGRFGAESGGEKISFRVSVLPTHYGEKITMRLLRDSVSGFTLESLGFHGAGLERVHEALRAKSGLVLVAGPRGAGKSTTLYTLLDILNTPQVDISTLEDPIKYRLKRVNQTEVQPELGFTYANELRALLRQDADIVMVGELRDEETSSLAVSAALRGRLVFAAIEADSAAGAISRLLDMGLDPLALASTLRLVVGQRLVRTLAPSEKKRHELSEDERGLIEELADTDAVLRTLKEEKAAPKGAAWRTITFYAPEAEGDSGYTGRQGIHEVLAVSPAVKELVMRGAADDITRQARREGMLTLAEDGLFRAAEGQTTIEEVLRAVRG